MKTASGLLAKLCWQREDFELKLELHCPAEGVSAIYGPSGAGKTTLLRCLAGLENAQQLEVSFNGDCWQSAQQFLPVHKRPLGFIFQEPSLFEHLSVRENLAFAEKRAGTNPPVCSFDQAVALLAIKPLLGRHPAHLSGGEKQRVAIARALLVKPKIIFMDEPLASLDMARKREILDYLEKIKRVLRVPMVYVSHSADEIARLADYLAVLDKGRLLAQGPINSLLSRLDLPIPLGEDAGVIIEAAISDIDTQWHLAKITLSPGQHLWFKDKGFTMGQAVRIRILARDVSVAVQEPVNGSIINVLPGRVVACEAEPHPATQLLKLHVAGYDLLARVTRYSSQQLNITAGQSIWIQIKSVAIAP
ncbi:MAG: molybdenum ABC transporter ATP-binding protein [Cellvibrionaceae bacterium]|nr:molybdenum ABC transporter ATP-binding protein [Cellvibrionaceae bacterium]